MLVIIACFMMFTVIVKSNTPIVVQAEDSIEEISSTPIVASDLILEIEENLNSQDTSILSMLSIQKECYW